jgi:(S)-2-hydroxyglutarate dehydrogenase
MLFDFCVIGGGIVGLATALELVRHRPGASIVLIEKEIAVGRHQTGHNSGVIHAGIYYKPGSLKAELCRRGAQSTKEFCEEHGIPFETRGKLVVATSRDELVRMNQLLTDARENRITAEAIDAVELRRREPNATGLGAIFVPETGIVDYRRMSEKMAALLLAAGGVIEFEAKVDAFREGLDGVTISAGERHWTARRLVVCGGLQSDRLAKLAGLKVDYQIVPFRGEYYNVAPIKRDLVRHLIYPVPDPELPFLGIHLTPMIDGGLTVGPNAVLGFSREGYQRFSFNARDFLEFAGFSGFWRVMASNLRHGLSEAANSLSKTRYLAECRKYCPTLELRDLAPREAGIRAQAVLRNGVLVHDFMFLRTARMLHVANAPSPAATACIPIGEMIAREAIKIG